MGKLKNKNNGYEKIIIIVLFLALMVGTYFQYQLSPLAPRLMEKMGLTTYQFSSIFSAPMIPSIFLGITAGILADRFGVKVVVSVGLVITTLGLCFRPFADTYITLLICMTLGGVGVSFLNTNVTKIISGWYPAEKVGTISGITLMGGTIGMTLGSATTVLLPSIRFAFWVAGIASIIILILWVVLVKDGKGNISKDTKSPVLAKESAKVVIRNKDIWIIGFCLMCVMGSNVAVASLLPTALQSRGINESSAGLLSSILNIGSMFGSLLGPVILARIGRMKPTLTIFSFLIAVGVIFCWIVPIPLMIILLLIIGFLIGTLIPILISFPVMLPEVGPIYAGSAGGVISTLQLLGAVIIPTHVITPIAGSNFTLYFLISGLIMAIMGFLTLLLPELNY